MIGERITDMQGLVRHHYGEGGKNKSAAAQPGVVGPAWSKTDAFHMMRSWWCDAPCAINKYDDKGRLKGYVEGELAGYTLMTITQMRDHLVLYHQNAGANIDRDFLNSLIQRADAIEKGFNDARKAQEAADAEELEKARKQFGYKAS